MEEVVKQFAFQDEQVRVLKKGDEPWFIAKDVCNVLGFSATGRVLSNLDEDEKGSINPNMHNMHVGGENIGDYMPEAGRGGREMAIINEPGLYSLILRSRKPKAKEFKRWITHEVIPSIRQTGGYMTPEKAMEMLSDPDTVYQTLESMMQKTAELRKQNSQQEMKIESQKEQIHTMQPRAKYCDEVLASQSLIATNIIAKELGMSAKTLNKKLHEWGVQYRQSGVWVLYVRYQNKGLGKMVTYTYNDSYGNPRTENRWKWTEKGRAFIHDLFERMEVAEEKER